MQKHNGKGDIRILCKHHSRADARNSYEVGSWLEIIRLSTPIGRGSGFKIRKVWIRIPPELPLSPLETIYSGWFIDYYYGDENVS